MFDFGQSCQLLSSGPAAFVETCNSAMYGQSEPPEYDQSKVEVNVAILEGGWVWGCALCRAWGAHGRARGTHVLAWALVGRVGQWKAFLATRTPVTQPTHATGPGSSPTLKPKPRKTRRRG